MGALTFPPGDGLSCGQQERDTEAAAEPERRHGWAERAPPLRVPVGRAPSLRPAVPSFSLDQVFYRLFYLTQS